ncbi:MAG: tyrosine--tRNA ligase [Chloroflexota bacterium]
MTDTLTQQVDALLQGTQFGDRQTGVRMAAELKARLAENRPLRVYLGVDPTAPDLHLGHAVPLQKLALFQAWGHDCILLIGDFTARIGDPSDKDKTRPQLMPAQIQANVETYRAQAFKLLDEERTQICFNSSWHNDLSFADVTQLAGQFTVAQFLARDNFAHRFANNEAIHLHEFFYALMQGYDAFALQADVQIGGTDQTFNILAGRRLQTAWGQPPQIMLTNPILPGTDGHRKMAKSLSNAIPLLANPQDMYGQVMSLPDIAMRPYFELLTTVPQPEIDTIFDEMERGQHHPRDVKMRLAHHITQQFTSKAEAAQAEAEFIAVFQRGDLPTEMGQYELKDGIPMIDLLLDLQWVKSKGEARRLIQQGGVRIDGMKITDIATWIEPARTGKTQILRGGKRRFIALVSNAIN